MTKIEWTERTLNIITGCTPKSEGCQNCYARKMHKRLAAMGQQKYAEPFEKVVFHGDLIFHEFDKLGKKPKMVFLNSMSDTFHEEIPGSAISCMLMRCRINQFFEPVPHTFQILTKRAERLPDFEYPANVWLGVTVELEKHKNRIEYLKQTNAKVKFLSCEPLLGDLGELDLTGIDWVIVGGESGSGARSCDPVWVRKIKQQCAEQGVPFFFKQWGEYLPIHTYSEKRVNGYIIGDDILTFKKVGKKRAGCLLDGVKCKEFPKAVSYDG